MTSGGIRTSVKAYINEQRLASLAVNHENNQGINTHLAPLAEATMAAASSNSYGLCDGNMPCLPILSSAAKSCEANQLPPAADTISVNGQPLTPEELRLLQSCPNPPKKLKPGNYWYDKICGLWGKEGQKPSEIISPHLCVGGGMKENASNGSTQVFINGREITKVELWVLQLVGVDCAGNPHFWVTEDGTYQEEGMNCIKGSIWRMAGTKLVCAVLSLPVPSRSSNPIIPEIIEQRSERTLQKILLVGCKGSGASTIFKQVIAFITNYECNLYFDSYSVFNISPR
ncbi:hypothetical protein ABKV19_024013 [Rosa sericea]